MRPPAAAAELCKSYHLTRAIELSEPSPIVACVPPGDHSAQVRLDPHRECAGLPSPPPADLPPTAVGFRRHEGTLPALSRLLHQFQTRYAKAQKPAAGLHWHLEWMPGAGDAPPPNHTPRSHHPGPAATHAVSYTAPGLPPPSTAAAEAAAAAAAATAPGSKASITAKCWSREGACPHRYSREAQRTPAAAAAAAMAAASRPSQRRAGSCHCRGVPCRHRVTVCAAQRRARAWKRAGSDACAAPLMFAPASNQCSSRTAASAASACADGGGSSDAAPAAAAAGSGGAPAAAAEPRSCCRCCQVQAAQACPALCCQAASSTSTWLG